MSWQLLVMICSGFAASAFLVEAIWSNRDDIITALIGPEDFDEV